MTPKRLSQYELAQARKFAAHEYPDESPSVGLRKYATKHRVPGLWFIGEDGLRYTWGKDLQDLERTTPNGNFYSVVKGQKDDYWAKKPRQKIPSPDEARRAKKPDFIAHPSERGWYLPTAHPRHFSRFPKEIIDIIFTNVLSMKFPDQLIPRTIERNSVTDFCRPSFEVQSTHSRLSPEETSTLCDDYYSSILWTQKHDFKGAFYEMRRILRPAIDSALLRTCKVFHENGRRILYGKNPFAFYTENTWCSFWDDEPRWDFGYLLIGNKVEHWPEGYIIKPSRDNQSWEMQVAEGLHQIKMHQPIQMLCGWVYFDPFLRFIYSIGPNAAMLKELTFHGMITTHLCDLTNCRGRQHGNLLERLKIYLRFIIKFCTKVEKLIIYAQDDTIHEEKPRRADDNRPRTTKEALLPLLERYFRQIPTLKHLEIFEVQTGSNRVYRHSSSAYAVCGRPEYAISSIEWLSQRGDIEGSNDLVMEAVENQTNHAVREFCGENHMWPECYNLCNFCGTYGHFKGSCPSFHDTM